MDNAALLASHLRAIRDFPGTETPTTSSGVLYLDAQLATLASTIRHAREVCDHLSEQLMGEGK